MTDDLTRVEQWIAGILAGLSPASRAQATRKIAQYLRGSQSRRIGAQKNPDGSAFEPRRPQPAPKPSNRPLKFIYDGGGQARTVLLKSWSRAGATISGYDVEAGTLGNFTKSKIIRWLSPTAQDRSKANQSNRPARRSRSRIMFKKLRRFGYLRAGGTASEAWVGFNGLAADIANVSQTGGYDKPSPRQAAIRYAERKLLGLTPNDDSQIMDILIGMFYDI